MGYCKLIFFWDVNRIWCFNRNIIFMGNVIIDMMGNWYITGKILYFFYVIRMWCVDWIAFWYWDMIRNRYIIMHWRVDGNINITRYRNFDRNTDVHLNIFIIRNWNPNFFMVRDRNFNMIRNRDMNVDWNFVRLTMRYSNRYIDFDSGVYIDGYIINFLVRNWNFTRDWYIDSYFIGNFMFDGDRHIKMLMDFMWNMIMDFNWIWHNMRNIVLNSNIVVDRYIIMYWNIVMYWNRNIVRNFICYMYWNRVIYFDIVPLRDMDVMGHRYIFNDHMRNCNGDVNLNWFSDSDGIPDGYIYMVGNWYIIRVRNFNNNIVRNIDNLFLDFERDYNFPFNRNKLIFYNNLSVVTDDTPSIFNITLSLIMISVTMNVTLRIILTYQFLPCQIMMVNMPCEIVVNPLNWHMMAASDISDLIIATMMVNPLNWYMIGAASER